MKEQTFFSLEPQAAAAAAGLSCGVGVCSLKAADMTAFGSFDGCDFTIRGDELKYLIMLLIVIGLAVADYITGCIKAYIKDDIKSVKMRKGGLNKLAEIVIMGVAIGSEVGFGQLGKYYDHQELGDIAGEITAIAVFIYIFAMEVVSILENYAEINPQAAWINKLTKKLSNVSGNDKNGNG